MPNAFSRLALKTAVTYGMVAALWILFSDWLLAAAIKDAKLVAEVSMIKGWGFVVVTAVLLYAVLRRGMQQLQRGSEARQESETRFR